MQTRTAGRPHAVLTAQPGCSAQRGRIPALPEQRLQRSQGRPLGRYSESLSLLASAHSPGTKLPPPDRVFGPLAWQRHRCGGGPACQPAPGSAASRPSPCAAAAEAEALLLAAGDCCNGPRPGSVPREPRRSKSRALALPRRRAASQLRRAPRRRNGFGGRGAKAAWASRKKCNA